MTLTDADQEFLHRLAGALPGRFGGLLVSDLPRREWAVIAAEAVRRLRSDGEAEACALAARRVAEHVALGSPGDYFPAEVFAASEHLRSIQKAVTI